MGGSCRVLVAPWGDPSRWVYTRYRGEDGVSVESFTSLNLLARGDIGVVVVAADTLGYGAPGGSYDDVVSTARSAVESRLCGVKAEVVVAPGVIDSSDALFKGSPGDYYYVTLYRLVERLLGVDCGSLSVEVDLTHGVNYMPALAFRAAREAAALAGLLVPTVNFKAYNSDPVMVRPKPCLRSGDDPCRPASPEECRGQMPEATVHKVVSHNVTPALLLSEIDEILAEERSKPSPLKSLGRSDGAVREAQRDASEAAGRVWLHVMRLLKMARLGLVPELLYYVTVKEKGLSERIHGAIGLVLDAWRRPITVAREDDRLAVRKPLGLAGHFKALVYAWAVAGAVEKIAAREGGPTVNAARAIADSFYHGTRIIKTIQDREIEKLDNALKKERPAEPILLRDLYGYLQKSGQTVKGLPSCQVFQRDLIAHGGWHTDLVVVEPEGDVEKSRVAVRDDPACIDKRDGQAVKKSVWEAL